MRRTPPQTRFDDEGMTFVELVFGLALLVVILTGALGIAFTVRAGERQATGEAFRARAVAYPLTRMSEIIAQNVRIDAYPAPGPYQVSVRTDQNIDDIQELHVFRIVTQGGESVIEHRSNLISMAGTVQWPARFVHQLGRHVTNQADGVPLFRYYDAQGAEIMSMGDVSAKARSLRVIVRARFEGRSITESTTVMFRNRE